MAINKKVICIYRSPLPIYMYWYLAEIGQKALKKKKYELEDRN